MTFDELEEKFPNGFVDTEIFGVTISYRDRTAVFRLNLRGNSPDSPNPQEYREAFLTLDRLHYVAIEPPDADHLFYPTGAEISADGLPEDPRSFPLIEDLKPKLQAGGFCCRFFVHDWNSFIHVAAGSAQFSWVESADTAAGAAHDL
jgi:hypothetical protein